MPTTPPRARTPACPVCGQPTLPASQPFCSRRCADLDLGKWLLGEYRIPVEDDEADSPPHGGNSNEYR